MDYSIHTLQSNGDEFQGLIRKLKKHSAVVYIWVDDKNKIQINELELIFILFIYKAKISVIFPRLNKVIETISKKNRHGYHQSKLTIPMKITTKSKTTPSTMTNVWSRLSKISYHTIRTMRTTDCNFHSKTCTPPSIFPRTIPIFIWMRFQ